MTQSTENLGVVKNVLLASDVKQSYRVGDEAEFMWMQLNKSSTTLTYTPPENNATGFTHGANSNSNVTGGSLNAILYQLLLMIMK